MAEGLEVESYNSTYFCHKCSQEISLHSQTELVCPECSSSFIEEVTPSLITNQLAQLAEYGSDEDDDDIPLRSPFGVSSLISQMLLDLPSPTTLRGDSSSTTEQGSSTEPSLSEADDDPLSLEGIVQQLSFGGRVADLAEDVFRVSFISRYFEDFGGDIEYDAIASQLLDEQEMSGPPPLSREQIQALPRLPINTEHLEKGSQCTVCMNDFRAREEAVFLPCAHMYHYKCITPWLQRQATCPNCREVIKVEAASSH